MGHDWRRRGPVPRPLAVPQRNAEAYCLLHPHPIGFELRYMLDGVQLIGVVSTDVAELRQRAEQWRARLVLDGWAEVEARAAALRASVRTTGALQPSLPSEIRGSAVAAGCASRATGGSGGAVDGRSARSSTTLRGLQRIAIARREVPRRHRFLATSRPRCRRAAIHAPSAFGSTNPISIAPALKSATSTSCSCGSVSPVRSSTIVAETRMPTTAVSSPQADGVISRPRGSSQTRSLSPLCPWPSK